MGRAPSATSPWSPNKTWRSPNATWLHVLPPFLPEKQARRLNHVALEPQYDMALLQCDVATRFASFSARKPSSLPLPRRVGTPTRLRSPPMRHGARFWTLFCSKIGLAAPATSRWSPIATSRPANATWRPVFGPFSRKNQVHRLYHVALEPQHDMALTQCDVAPPFVALAREN